MSETAVPLTPANQNLWYVLMTLYGEQERGVPDRELRERWRKSREVWNGWAYQPVEGEEYEAAARKTGLAVREFTAWRAGTNFHQDVPLHHEEEMRRRNPPGFVYPGFPQADAGYDLQKLHFENPLRLEQFAFFNLVDFYGCTFALGLAAQKALFSGPSSFTRGSFLKAAGFQSATFDGAASFLTCDFQELAGFHRTRFNADTEFAEAEFVKGVDFESATFAGFTHFQSAKFLASDEKGRQKLDFVDCNFEKPANFLRARFVSKYPNLVGSLVHERSLFSASPEFWPEHPKQDLTQARASCGTIRHILGQQGQAEEEHFFFRREMGFAGQIGGWWWRLPYRAFGAFSDYGYSIAKPAFCLIGLLIAAAMVNHVVLQWGASMGNDADYHPAQAFGLSFANLFPVFGLHKLWFTAEFLTGLNGWLKFLGGVETVFSLPLLFFLGLGLRTRFRLR